MAANEAPRRLTPTVAGIVPCPKCGKPLRVATVDYHIGLECASSDCGFTWPKEEEA